MMRAIIFHGASALAVLTLSGVAIASPGAGSGTIKYRATATYSDGTSADRLYAVWRDDDSDGDGIGDETWLRVRCNGAMVAAAFEYNVKAPRDVATGQASGKRMHKPFTIIKEWGASTPMLGKTGGGKAAAVKVSWDLVQGKGARVDHSRASDASAGKGAAGERATYDVKKNEGARVGVGGKTMAWDDWHETALTAGSPNLCAHGAEDQ